MPLLQYFGFVGPALIMLLLGVNWMLPPSTTEYIQGTLDRPSIRISSIETLPERIVFDTSLPQIAPSPIGEVSAILRLQSAFEFAQITPGQLPTFSKLAEVVMTQVNASKYITGKSLVGRRTTSKAHLMIAKKSNVREVKSSTVPPVRTTFLHDIAGRFGQMFKVN